MKSLTPKTGLKNWPTVLQLLDLRARTTVTGEWAHLLVVVVQELTVTSLDFPQVCSVRVTSAVISLVEKEEEEVEEVRLFQSRLKLEELTGL